MTTVYICRHSDPFKEHRGKELNSLDKLTINMMSPLSVLGEKKAERLSEYLKNIDVVWSSNYSRAMSTAKYIAYKNDLKVNVDERLGERIHGNLDNIDIKEFYNNQMLYEDYKLDNGESRIEVTKRMLDSLYEILEENNNKNIFICSHSTSIIFLLMKWCTIDYDNKVLNYNNKFLFDFMNWNAPELFKLTFNNKELINIEHIKGEEYE